jgi:ribosomal protein S18 acetylase RimI-like enzyme
MGFHLIRFLEEISLNAWPALHIILLDGWVLRFANGYTRRANSVNPLYISIHTLPRKIQTCERMYSDQGLKSIFKLTPASEPPGLDAHLAEAGYRVEARTSVQLLEMENYSPHIDPDVEMYREVVADWHEAYCSLNGFSPEYLTTVRQLLELQINPMRLAILRREGKAVSCGMGVRQSQYIGLFDIVVDPQLRRQGYGQRMVESLLSWGKTEGAQTAYLQVMLGNVPALQLYSRLGFQEEYQYWYRVKG